MLREGAVLVLLRTGPGGQEGCWQGNDSLCKGTEVGESRTWPGQVQVAGCVQGCMGEAEGAATGRHLSPEQPGLGDWPSHPILKAKVVVEPPHTSMASTEQTGPHHCSPRTQKPGQFLQLEGGGEKGLKRVPVFQAADLRAARMVIGIQRESEKVSGTGRDEREKREGGTGGK